MHTNLSARTSVERPLTKRPGARALRVERSVVLLMVLLPTAGTMAGLTLLVRNELAWHDHLLFVVMYLVSGFGITVGYHRLFTHRAFETSTTIRVLLAVAGAMAFQGPVIRWAADHRRHHAFTDRAGDPHSPILARGDGRLETWSGIWHAHVGWLFDRERTVVRHFAADLVRDPWIAWVDRMYLCWVFLSIGLPGVIGYALSGTTAGAWHGVVWVGLTRIFAVQHVTWAVNSLCHTFGRQPLGTGDGSRNQPIIAVLALGEGWHNNHHAQPGAAIHGLGSREIDLSGLVIQLLERAHLIWGVRGTSPPELLEAIQTGASGGKD